ncbi:putative mis12 domain-containing protein [Diplogelasinospora grovesii]|uniref:Mis12 domain-containing protein n=1 Tax=Diplogelasinospora grovesii TaxID=303347 RepID=A0AAN6S620_9PEZI|nr:putative mis12 domain-containing protein [Diplogelasinospora grovesii]
MAAAAPLPPPAVNSDTALLTEHFGYPPVSLLDDIINSINILAERALNSVEQGLLNAPPASLGFRPPTHSTADAPEAHRNEIESGTHQLETLLCASIDKNFDVFEIYVMRNILCVRPEDRDWIRLSHYAGLDFSPNKTKDKDGPTVESVNRLRRRLQASQKLNCMLHAEKARNDALLSELRKLVGKPTDDIKEEDEAAVGGGGGCGGGGGGGGRGAFAFLQNKGDLTVGDAETPLTTTTAFTLSQLQALRALSTSLRNILPDLVAHQKQEEEEDDGGRDKKSWRRERLEYIETATRKHLENVRGLELGRNGEVRDGEWQGSGQGKSLAKEEVEGLEHVVTLLGNSGASGSGGGGGGAESGGEMDVS